VVSTRLIRWTALLLWTFILGYLVGVCRYEYTHRPCADVNGKPAILNGEKGCLEERK
jgi:hypothetical protein